MNLFYIDLNIVYLLAFSIAAFLTVLILARSYMIETPAKLAPLDYTTILYGFLIDIIIL